MSALAVVEAGQVRLIGLRAESEEGEGSHEEAHEAEHPWLAEPVELIWGTLTFAIIAAALIWKALPAAKKMAADRTARIAAELAGAANARREAEQASATVVAQLADADNESARIVAEARASAEGLRTDSTARLQTEIAELRTRALADIESSKARAVQELQASVAVLAVGAAEQVVRRSLDDATQQALVERFIDDIARTEATA